MESGALCDSYFIPPSMTGQSVSLLSAPLQTFKLYAITEKRHPPSSYGRI